MWFLWILIVIYIPPSSHFDHYEEHRYEHSFGIKAIGKIPPSAFNSTTTVKGKYEITSLSGFVAKNDNSQSDDFDRDFSTRAFRIGFPATENKIQFEMEIDAKHTYRFYIPFGIPCLCYTDNLEDDPSNERYDGGKWGNQVINYCGKKHSMICYDYHHKSISSNPSIIKSTEELLKMPTGHQTIFRNLVVREERDKGVPIKITFTIEKNTTNKAHFEFFHINEKGNIAITQFKTETGYQDFDSTPYTIINVVPFQIFNPWCPVKWSFINGKPMEYSNPFELDAKVDPSKFLIGDKRTKFPRRKKEEKKKETTDNSAAATTSMTASFITLFFCILILFV